MPLWGKKNNNSGNNNNNNGGGSNQDSDDDDNCPWGNACPSSYHWYTDSDGDRVHDPSGARAYLDNTVFNDTYGIGSKLPKTPPIEEEKKPKRNPWLDI